MILVTSASGRTGRSVVKALVRAGQHVRAIDIDPAVETLASPGAIGTVVGDLLDADALQRAMVDISCVIHIGPAWHPREAEIGHAVVSAARTSGVAHFVQFSVIHPQLEPLLNHQAKLTVERLVLTSRMPFTILQPMTYMQNADVRESLANGVLRRPYSIDTPLAHVDLEDVSEVATLVVREGPRHHFATYELCGTDCLSARGLAEIIAAESGRQVTAEKVALASMPLAQGLSRENRSETEDYRLDGLTRLVDHYERYGLTGNPNVLTWLLGRRPTTFREYVRRCLQP